MSTYDAIKAQADEQLERWLISILSSHVGKENRISRKELVRQAAGSPRHKASDDRKVRLAIASLQGQGYPILSDSGAGGYWMGKPDEIEGYIAELESRRATLADKIKSLRNARKGAQRPIQERLL